MECLRCGIQGRSLRGVSAGNGGIQEVGACLEFEGVARMSAWAESEPGAGVTGAATRWGRVRHRNPGGAEPGSGPRGNGRGRR